MFSAPLSRWTLQEAKSQLNEVVRRVLSEGPQLVTGSGQDAVVILSSDEYDRLTQPQRSLVAFLRSSPLADVDIDFNRPEETGRGVGVLNPY